MIFKTLKHKPIHYLRFDTLSKFVFMFLWLCLPLFLFSCGNPELEKEKAQLETEYKEAKQKWQAENDALKDKIKELENQIKDGDIVTSTSPPQTSSQSPTSTQTPTTVNSLTPRPPTSPGPKVISLPTDSPIPVTKPNEIKYGYDGKMGFSIPDTAVALADDRTVAEAEALEIIQKTPGPNHIKIAEKYYSDDGDVIYEGIIIFQFGFSGGSIVNQEATTGIKPFDAFISWPSGS